jgi:hypothetical protein
LDSIAGDCAEVTGISISEKAIKKKKVRLFCSVCSRKGELFVVERQTGEARRGKGGVWMRSWEMGAAMKRVGRVARLLAFIVLLL